MNKIINNNRAIDFKGISQLDVADIHHKLSKHGYVSIRGFLSRSEAHKIVDNFKSNMNVKDDQPTIGSTPSDLKEYYQKLSIGGRMDGWDYRPRYVRVCYTPLWGEDKFLTHDVFQKFAMLRNKIQNHHEQFAINDVEDGFWTAARLQHYPAGGGFFAKHKDVVLEKVTKGALIQDYHQFLLLLTTKGTHFTEGGGYTYDKTSGKQINFEDIYGGGDVIIYDGTNEHGVADIDPQSVSDTSTKEGRLVAIVSLYKDMFNDERPYEKSRR